MNQCSPVAVHSLREAHACHVPIDAVRSRQKTAHTQRDSSLGNCHLVEEITIGGWQREPRAPLRSEHSYQMEEIQCTGRPTAPIITRYRCFLPDLAGLAGLRRVGPGTVTIYHSKTISARSRSTPVHYRSCFSIPATSAARAIRFFSLTRRDKAVTNSKSLLR